MNISLAADGGSVEVSDAAFGREFNEALVHQSGGAYGGCAAGLPCAAHAF